MKKYDLAELIDHVQIRQWTVQSFIVDRTHPLLATGKPVLQKNLIYDLIYYNSVNCSTFRNVTLTDPTEMFIVWKSPANCSRKIVWEDFWTILIEQSVIVLTDCSRKNESIIFKSFTFFHKNIIQNMRKIDIETQHLSVFFSLSLIFKLFLE